MQVTGSNFISSRDASYSPTTAHTTVFATAVTTYSSANDTSSPLEPSLSVIESKNPKDQAMNPLGPMEGLHSPSLSPPQSLAPTYRTVAYAERPHLRSAEFYRSGSGLQYSHSSHRPRWFDAWRGFALDVVEEVKDLFRGPEDPFADLRGRAQIVVGVEVKQTIASVEN